MGVPVHSHKMIVQDVFEVDLIAYQELGDALILKDGRDGTRLSKHHPTKQQTAQGLPLQTQETKCLLVCAYNSQSLLYAVDFCCHLLYI